MRRETSMHCNTCGSKLLATDNGVTCFIALCDDELTSDLLGDYDRAVSDPAPADDGGTTSQELEDILERAISLLDEYRFAKNLPVEEIRPYLRHLFNRVSPMQC